MTALTTYLTATADTLVITTANTILENPSTGASPTNKNTNITASTTGWIDIWSQGNASASSGAGSESAPTGHGWIDDGTVLVGNHFQAGTWSFSGLFNNSGSSGSFAADVHFRAYQRSSGGTYTLIAEASSGSTSIAVDSTNSTYTTVTASVSASASNQFVTGDKLYVDIEFNITTNTTSGNIRCRMAASGSSTGLTGVSVTTPGYISSTQVDHDLQIRGRIQQLVTKDLQTRGRIQALTTKDLQIRANVGLVSKRDLQTRGRIQALGDHDLQIRGRIQILTSRDLQTRGRIKQLINKDLQTRGRIQQLTSRDLQIRGRLKQLVNKDLQLRANIYPSSYKDLQIRGNISGPPIASGQFTLFGSGTGTVSYDSVRWTEYPDPALVLAPIAPRIGQTSIIYNANVPPNTTLAVSTSLDGVNWTDQTSSNGGSIANIISQPQPTIEGFSTLTSANYTNTSQVGGSAATWTYDTTNTRVTATGGTHGLYLNSSVSQADIDFFADLDEADAGGLVWRYQNSSNFYYVQLADMQSSSGTTNTATLYKVSSGTDTLLGTANLTYIVGQPTNQYRVWFTRGTFRRFRITMKSGIITFYMDGNILLTYTDASPFGAGLCGLYNNGGSSRYYQLWIQPLGQIVTGSPAYNIVNGTFVYTKCALSTTDPTQTPQVSDLSTFGTTPEISTGAVIPTTSYSYTSTSTVFDDMVNASGDYYWYIDPNKHLYFTQNGTIAAPWIVQSNSVGLVNANDIDVNSDFEVYVSNDLYRNRQTILGAQGVTGTQVATLSGDGSTTSFTLGFPLASVPIIYLDGIAQSVGLKGNTGYQWYYALDDATIQQDSSYQAIASTDELLVIYTGFYDVIVTIDDTTEQAARAIIEGGSGIVESVEDHSQDNPKLSEAEAVVLAQGLISRYAIAGRTLIFDTSRDGLQLGQTVTIFLPEHGLWNVQALINQIEIKLSKDINDHQVWWYKVQASELPRQASWAKLLAQGLGLGDFISVD